MKKDKKIRLIGGFSGLIALFGIVPLFMSHNPNVFPAVMAFIDVGNAFFGKKNITTIAMIVRSHQHKTKVYYRLVTNYKKFFTEMGELLKRLMHSNIKTYNI